MEPSDKDDLLAPETRSLSNPVTSTKPSSRENQTLADAPKKSQKVTRKFSEADIQDSTPLKRPELSTRPSIASQSPEIAAVEQAQSQSPLPTSFRPALHSNGPTSRTTMQVEEGSKHQPDNNHNLKYLIVAGMERMQITSSLASEDEYAYIHNPQDSSEVETDGMETTPSLSSEDGKARTHDAQDSSEAETDRMMTMPSLTSEDKVVRTYTPQDSSEAETHPKKPTPSLGGEIFKFFGIDVIMY